jgi:hypothetical protein
MIISQKERVCQAIEHQELYQIQADIVLIDSIDKGDVFLTKR